jgi:hypothetical protein
MDMIKPLAIIEENRIEMDRFLHMESVVDLNFVKKTNFSDRIVMNYTIKDPDLKFEYFFEVQNSLISNSSQIQWQTPLLKLLSPIIKINLDIHMLVNGIVCYTFPGDIKYNKGLTCGYAIEQSFKWAFGYEHYLRNNYWPFKEMPHGIYPIHWGFSRPSIAA